MTFCFSVDEILDMAEQIERNGARFYREAADQGEGALHDKLLELARMEDAHEKLFADIRSELASGETKSTTYDPEGDIGQYLTAMADSSVFNQTASPAALVRGKSVSQILELALGFEKDSILFYLGLRSSLSHAAGKDRMDQVLEEEMAHVAFLRNQLRSFT